MSTVNTPGPWAVRPHPDGVFIVGGDYLSSGSVICEIRKYTDAPSESYANAHLIAAAPDLYAAIDGAMEYLRGTLGDCDVDCECILHAFEAALAKAQGRR